MKIIRYWTTHPIKSPSVWVQKLGLSTNEYELVLDPRDPEFVIATEHIYFDQIAKTMFRRLYAPQRIMIFWAGECISPDLNLFDYAVVYDKHTAYPERTFRRPVLFLHGNFQHDSFNDWHVDADVELKSKTGFCNFIYSNPDAHPRRDGLFHDLSRYRHVDSLGRHLKNCRAEDSRGAKNFDELSVLMKRPYKFSVASENASFVGYTSEKIITSFLAHTVPIYWGNPDVASEFNPEAFINANELSTEELIDTVRAVDQNDQRWMDMVSAPPLTPLQLKAAEEGEQSYRSKMSSLFGRTLKDIKCRPEGYWPDNYRRTFFNGRTCQVTKRNRILKLLGRETMLAEFLIRKLRPL